MPYTIEKIDGEYCVIKETDGESMGCHPTRAQAMEQMAALYANEMHKSDTDPLAFKCVPFEVKAAADDGTFEGLCSVFNNIDAYGEIVHPDAFTQDMDAFLKDGFIGGLNHDWDHPIGRPMDARLTPSGLMVKGKISDTPHGRECHTLMRDGVVKKLSIGYRAAGKQPLETPEDCLSYWEGQGYTPSAEDLSRVMHGATVLTRVKLYEFSPVTMPANDLASITRVKSEDLIALQSLSDVEEFLRDAGRFSRREAKALISHLKTLLRDAESETHETAPEETVPPEETETKDGETPPVAPIIGLPDSLLRESPADDLPLVLKAQRQRIASALYQQYLKTGVK